MHTKTHARKEKQTEAHMCTMHCLTIVFLGGGCAGKVLFLAPTKPLVTQQIRACYEVMGIPQDHMVRRGTDSQAALANLSTLHICYTKPCNFRLASPLRRLTLSQKGGDERCVQSDQAAAPVEGEASVFCHPSIRHLRYRSWSLSCRGGELRSTHGLSTTTNNKQTCGWIATPEPLHIRTLSLPALKSPWLSFLCPDRLRGGRRGSQGHGLVLVRQLHQGAYCAEG